MKHLLAFLLLAPGVVYPQACTNAGSGNVCTPGTFKQWGLLNHAADTGSSDIGCYYSGNITFAPNSAQIVMQQGSYNCGESDTTAGSQSYLTGAMVWSSLSYVPTAGHPITIEAKAQMGRGWSAIWLLGSNCQSTTLNQSWDNIGTCNWSSDASDSSEIDIAEICNNCGGTGYTNNSEHIFMNGTSSGHSGQTISDVTTNVHLYHLDWSLSQVCWAVDGVSGGCASDLVPQHPMFLVINNRQQSGNIASPMPTTMTVQYVQVCDGTTCTSQNSSSGNTLYYDNFATATSGPTSLGGLASVAGKGSIQ